MKKLLLSITLFFVFGCIPAQMLCSMQVIDFNFESSACPNFVMDTTHAFNSWQIGKPMKSVFNAAYSPQNVIITDTTNAYPVNDTSVFYVLGIAESGYASGHTAILSGYYNVNSDSLNDYGTIEVSLDNGTSWIDIVNPGTYASAIWWNTPEPVLTGNSNGWVQFWVNLPSLGPIFNVNSGDTIRYRFTFISDSIPDTLDGLMFDDFHFEDWAEGIEEFNTGNLHVTTNPNPATDHLSFAFENPGNAEFILKVYDVLGNEVMNENAAGKPSFEIDVSKLDAGLYYYHLSNSTGDKSATGKFVVKAN